MEVRAPQNQNINVEVRIDPDAMVEKALKSFQTQHSHEQKQCFCNG